MLKFCPSMYLVSTIELYQWDLLISIFYDKKFYCSNFIAESFFYYVLLFIIELLKYMYILICNQKKKNLWGKFFVYTWICLKNHSTFNVNEKMICRNNVHNLQHKTSSTIFKKLVRQAIAQHNFSKIYSSNVIVSISSQCQA